MEEIDSFKTRTLKTIAELSAQKTTLEQNAAEMQTVMDNVQASETLTEEEKAKDQAIYVAAGQTNGRKLDRVTRKMSRLQTEVDRCNDDAVLAKMEPIHAFLVANGGDEPVMSKLELIRSKDEDLAKWAHIMDHPICTNEQKVKLIMGRLI